MDTRPGSGERLAEIGGIALILIMFLFAWFAVDAEGADINGFDAFDGFSDWIGLVLTFTAFSGIALGVFGAAAARNRVPVSLTALTAGLGIVSVVLIVIFGLISTPDISLGGSDSIETSRKIGVWLGLLASAAVAFGGWNAMQSEGTSFGEQRDRLQDRFDAGSEPPSAPPPPPPPTTTGAP